MLVIIFIHVNRVKFRVSCVRDIYGTILLVATIEKNKKNGLFSL